MATASISRYPIIRMLPGHHKRVRAGHPWVYSNEIEMDVATKGVPPGSPVAVVTHDGEPLGTALFNPHSLICGRMVDRDPDRVIDGTFLRERLEAALALRGKLFRDDHYRLIHAEADGLPGLIVDRYGKVLVAQINTAGMARLEAALVDALRRLLGPAAIVLRADGAARQHEGLSIEPPRLAGTLPDPVPVSENGMTFLADPMGGQKTGWFFDQREHRAAVARLAAGARVLDLYCHTGGFGLLAASAGAAAVTLVDRSKPALALAEGAAARNGLSERCTVLAGDVFHNLETRGRRRERWDIVVADPPAFVKSKKDLASGVRGYRKLVGLAAPVVKPGGFLFIASCSHHVDSLRFSEQVRQGLARARRNGRILRFSGAAPDHPVHPFLPETGYLKAMLLQLD